jgi:Fic family protein
MTEQLPLSMTSGVTIRERKYLKTHPWLSFSIDFRPAAPSFWAMLGECKSKCEHIRSTPLRPDIAQILHSTYLAKGVWGTTAIEGNTLSESEVLRHVEGKLVVTQDKEYLQQEVDNILQEANRMLLSISRGEKVPLTPQRIKEVNSAVLKGLTLDPEVEPGKVRRHSVGVMNYRGAPAQDCEFLLHRLCDWLNSSEFDAPSGMEPIHMAILKAVIAHLYLEWIHPFGDGNGRTGRLIEVQILLGTGIPSAACHLFSNHYNLTRREYLAQLSMASKSGGKVIPFLTYALNGFLEGLRGQLAYVRKLQMGLAWESYIHEHFGSQLGGAAERRKNLLLDIYGKDDPVAISEIDQVSPRTARAYAGMTKRTISRDVEILENKHFLVRSTDGKTIRANVEIMTSFLPTAAV